MNDQMTRWYREARRRGATATDALANARTRQTLWDADLTWYAEPDTDFGEGLVVMLADDDGNVLDSIGGVDVAYWVSDHGNVHYDDNDLWLITLVGDMVAEVTA